MSEVIQYHNLHIFFTKTKYLNSFNKFPKLYALFGRSKTLETLYEKNYIINEAFFIYLFKKYPIKFYIQKEFNISYILSHNINEHKSTEIKGLLALELYGIDILENTIEKRYTELTLKNIIML